MLKYRGHQYREALTSEQKKLKRQYLLEQQQQQDRIPTFEEVWRYHLEFGDLDVEDTAYMFEDDFDDDDVLSVLVSTGTVPNAYDLDDEQQEALAEEHRVRVVGALAAKKALLYHQDQVEDLYDDAVYRVEHELAGADCWRVIRLPLQLNPAAHQGIGIYWSYEERAAEAHYGHRGKGDTQKLRYRAAIEIDHVDKEGTILANTDPSIGEMEKEVRFHEAAPIYVYDVELEDGTVLEINDWRTT